MTKPRPTVARVTHALDAVVLVCGKVVAWLIVPMVLSLCYEVVARYVFNAPTQWAYDMTFMLYGSVLHARRGVHAAAHGPCAHRFLLCRSWSPRHQALVDLACYVLMLLPFAGVRLRSAGAIFVKAYGHERNLRQQLRGSRSPGRSSWRCR